MADKVLDVRIVNCQWCLKEFSGLFAEGSTLTCPSCGGTSPKRMFGFKGGYKK